jgi:signal transduction histidine kinase
LLKKILQKIYELFSNVFRHSESALGLFCSGQFYPKSEQFKFTIADNGTTIKTKVNRYLLKEFIKNRSTADKVFGKKFDPINGVEAIKWALEDKHSTTGGGGLGLSLLMDLITISGGSIEIISNDGYYSIKDGVESTKKLNESFEGTIVSIELNTESSRYYFLKEEQNANS